MAFLTTGLIENSEVLGVRPSVACAVKISNAQQVKASTRINGFYWNRTAKTEYVVEILTLEPGETINLNFYAQFDFFEFQFIAGSEEVEISAWGINAGGDRTAVFSLLPADLLAGPREGLEGAAKTAVPAALDRIYVLNAGEGHISVIDGERDQFLGNMIAGSGPFGLGVNTNLNQVYVANFGSQTVAVLDGNTNQLLTTIAVGRNPVGVGVNSYTNRIYVANWRGHNVSVIDGSIHVVVATIQVEAFPEGVAVNPATNRIYVTHRGSSRVSVLDGSANKVIAGVEI